MSSPLQKLANNNAGNDYVIGDLHGCIDLLERLLIEVNFNKNTDRLFSVGDLIDRGPAPLACLHLLAEPWFYAVQGNHENMMLEFFQENLMAGQLPDLDYLEDSDFFYNGGEWVKDYFQTEQQCMTAEFNQCLTLAKDLPMIYIVGEGKQRFHVIHAELTRPKWKPASPLVWLDHDIDQWLIDEALTTDIETRLLWSRTLMSIEDDKQFNRKQQIGLSTTFCGHTFARKPRQVLSHVCIDTGAYLSINCDNLYGLTLFDIRNSQYLLTSYQNKEVIRHDFPISLSV